MAADLTTVQKRVTSIIDACIDRTFTTVVDPRKNWNANTVTEAVREGALMIAQAICANPKHVHRNAFVSGTPTAITQGAELPDLAGEHDLVEIQPYSGASFFTGTPRTMQQIDSWRTNPSSVYGSVTHTTQNSPLTGYYAINNGRLKFTGNAAQMYHPVISRSTVTSLIPDEYEGAWVALGVGLVPTVPNDITPFTKYYLDFGMQMLTLITSMGATPTLPSPERAMKARSDV